jgi:hypothetical protein|tara:strand:+ start:224 stop:514 length:291 start_codon:yes stop_codon:yes gene_type:complete
MSYAFVELGDYPGTNKYYVNLNAITYTRCWYRDDARVLTIRFTGGDATDLTGDDIARFESALRETNRVIEIPAKDPKTLKWRPLDPVPQGKTRIIK